MTVVVTAATERGSTGEIALAIGAALTEQGSGAGAGARGGPRHRRVRRRRIGQRRVRRALAAFGDGSGGPRFERWAGRPVWLFSSGPVGDPAQSLTQKRRRPVDLPNVRALTGAREHRMFPGRLDRKNLPFPRRMALSPFRGMQGEFRDWDAIRAWAAGIADALHEAPAR